eukprot:7412311-Alexandrium_andersonii.AAC.1
MPIVFSQATGRASWRPSVGSRADPPSGQSVRRALRRPGPRVPPPPSTAQRAAAAGARPAKRRGEALRD